MLRQLIEERHEIVTSLANAERQIDYAPTGQRAAERDRAQAEQRVADSEAALTRARAVLDRYDRPLHRRRHATEIDAAQRDVANLPKVIADGIGAIGEANQRLEQIDEKLDHAHALISRRPSLETQVAEIDDRLDADLRRRTRIARLEQPTAIVAVLGERPAPGAAAHEWDQAAGRLHQHQAAFDITAGIGRLPGYFDNTAYAASHRHVEQEVKSVVYVPELPSRGIESPGISL